MDDGDEQGDEVGCFHGGASFEWIGEDLDRLEARRDVVDADVLDAWFDPAPGVLYALGEHLPWSLRRSPPTSCAGFLRAVSAAREVPIDSLVPGAGSSDLIFRALGRLLTQESVVVLPEPTYGEYAHVLERVVGARVERLPLRRDQDYELDFARLTRLVAAGPDLVVLVNPNSPTGRHADPTKLRSLIADAPARTRFWIDETYVDYVGREHSLESFAAGSTNTLVVKSMSKVYALSGVRAAYLVAPRSIARDLLTWTPPWAVSLPAQIAAVRALADPTYYAARYAETHERRTRLATALRGLGLDVVPGCANFLLTHLPQHAATAATIVEHCRSHGVHLRDASDMGAHLDDRALRVAVKSERDQEQVLAALRATLEEAVRLQ